MASIAEKKGEITGPWVVALSGRHQEKRADEVGLSSPILRRPSVRNGLGLGSREDCPHRAGPVGRRRERPRALPGYPS